jgi:hypothetical protein
LTSFFGRPLNTVRIRRRIQTTEGYNFLEENSKFYDETFKGLSSSITPFGMRKFIRIVEIIILNIVVLSIRKIGCENYLFLSIAKIQNH